MWWDYDKESKSLYVAFNSSYRHKESKEHGNHIILDYNTNNKLMGFEILF